MRYLIPLIVFVLIFPSNTFSDNFNKDVSGQGLGRYSDSKIFLSFIDEKLKDNWIIVDDGNKQEKIELKNPKLKFRDDGFLIIDENRNFILYKETKSGFKILAKIKLDDKKIKILFKENIVKKNTGQRDLLAEMNQKKNTVTINSFKESQYLDKSKKIDESIKIYQEKLERLENNKLSKTKQEVDYNSYEQYKKSIYDRDDNRPKPTINLNTSDEIGSMQLFLSSPKTIQWKSNFKYDVLVTDETRNKYESNYNSFIGNPIDNVIISSVIKNPLNSILHESDGITDKNGLYEDSFVIPDRSTTRGEYTIQITATKSIDGVILKESSSKVFFVVPISSSYNNPPVAILDNISIVTSIYEEDNVFRTIPTLDITDSKLGIFSIVTMNQTKTIIDAIDSKLKITAVVYNSTHFMGDSNFTINYEDKIESKYATFEQLKQLLNGTQIINTNESDELIWNFNQTAYVELDASNSYDQDDSFDVLRFLWKILNPEENNYIIDESKLTGSKPIISLNAETKEVFEFELNVNDGRKTSRIPAYMNVTVYNGTLFYEDNGSYVSIIDK